MIKYKLSKDDYEKLSDVLKSEYKKDGDGYKLDMSDEEDPTSALRARDYEKTAKKEAKAKVRELEQQIEALKKSGNSVEDLEESWKSKLEIETGTLKQTIAAREKMLRDVVLEHTGSALAGAITAKPENAALMLPHITPRLDVAFDGEKPSVKVKDKDGKLSALSLDDFKKELTTDPKFASVVVVSRATGGGASGGGTGNGHGGAGGPKKLADMSEPERVQMARDNPTEFKALVQASRAESFATAS